MEHDHNYRVGTVSFFNARPLDFTLAQHHQVTLRHEVPSRLAQSLADGTIHVAMLPSIDYQNAPQDLAVLPVAAIGSCGEVLTVRVFSRGRADQIARLLGDPDSHTSIVLAQIIWRLRYRRQLQIIPIKDRTQLTPPSADALPPDTGILLIGDKVIPQLGRWPCELDLGQAWTEHTDLPFVYAFWVAAAPLANDDLVEILRHSYQQGLAQLDDIAERFGPRHGFDVELARRYLTENICYELGPSQHRGLSEFYELASQFGLAPLRRTLQLHTPLNCPP